MKREGNYKRGKENPSFKHGMKGTPTWNTWMAMKYRACSSKRERDQEYRKMGICKRWLKFENFFMDMGLRPEGCTIERIKNNKGYMKSNCKWATLSEQNINKRHRPYKNKHGYRGLKKNTYSYYEVRVGGVYVGRSKDLIEAAQMYDEYAIKKFGTNALLNFPKD